MKDIEIPEAEKRFEGYRYGDFKKAVADAVIEELEPFQNRYKEIIANKSYEAVLRQGAEKASKIANETLKRIQKAVGLLQI
jgi:tryptophanyl-tRNA synthetase